MPHRVHVVPHGGAAEVYVEVGVRAAHRQQAEQLSLNMTGYSNPDCHNRGLSHRSRDTPATVTQRAVIW